MTKLVYAGEMYFHLLRFTQASDHSEFHPSNISKDSEHCSYPWSFNISLLGLRKKKQNWL